MSPHTKIFVAFKICIAQQCESLNPTYGDGYRMKLNQRERSSKTKIRQLHDFKIINNKFILIFLNWLTQFQPH